VNRHATRYDKRDATEPEILAALDRLGVYHYAAGPLDHWIWLGRFVPLEIKTEDGVLTKGQQDFVNLCEERGWPYRIWRTPNEAIEAVNLWREQR
jgi:hypothetical protein